MQNEILAVCPYFKCNKVILRKLKAIIEVETKQIIAFNTICPHCKEPVKITLGVAIKVEPNKNEY